MKKVESNLAFYKKALSSREKLKEAHTELAYRLENSIGDEFISGEARIFDRKGKMLLRLDLEKIITQAEIAEFIARRINKIEDYINEVEPVLKMAEMAFKGMEKKS